MLQIIKELLIFFINKKKYWILPILFVFILFGSLLIFVEGTVVAPFVYTLF